MWSQASPRDPGGSRMQWEVETRRWTRTPKLPLHQQAQCFSGALLSSQKASQALSLSFLVACGHSKRSQGTYSLSTALCLPSLAHLSTPSWRPNPMACCPPAWSPWWGKPPGVPAVAYGLLGNTSQGPDLFSVSSSAPLKQGEEHLCAEPIESIKVKDPEDRRLSVNISYCLDHRLFIWKISGLPARLLMPASLGVSEPKV